MPSATRPEAIPPTAAPRKKGVTSEDTANRVPNRRLPAIRREALRKANPAPRRTMPTAARASGTHIAENTVWKKTGNPVHMMTKMKISQTLLTSHTGAMAWSISHRGRLPRSAPPEVRSQKPAP